MDVIKEYEQSNWGSPVNPRHTFRIIHDQANQPPHERNRAPTTATATVQEGILHIVKRNPQSKVT